MPGALPLWTAFALQLLAVSSLARARGDRARLPWLVLGLTLFVAALALVIDLFGTALGLAWGLTVVSLAGYLRFVRPLLVAPSIGVVRRVERGGADVPQAAVRRGPVVLRLLAAGPLYLLAALGIGVVLATRLPWAEVNRLMLGGMLVPVLWALGALHATADTRIVRVLAAPLLLALVSAALFFVP